MGVRFRTGSAEAAQHRSAQMPNDVVHRTIREQIADRLRRDVLSGALGSGAPLREEALAQRFGVSRGPIRDALIQLTQEGLLVAKPNCGVRVREAPGAEIQKLVVDMRRRIEALALRQGFRRIADEGLPRLEGIVDAIKTACEEEDLPSLVEHDMAFHRAIVEMAEDDDLVAIWMPIVVRMMLHYSRHEDLMESYREHVAVVDAIRAKDRRVAVAALKENFQ